MSDDHANQQHSGKESEDPNLVQPDPEAPGLSVLDEQPGETVEPNEPA